MFAMRVPLVGAAAGDQLTQCIACGVTSSQPTGVTSSQHAVAGMHDACVLNALSYRLTAVLGWGVMQMEVAFDAR
jgi:hypothetical protein